MAQIIIIYTKFLAESKYININTLKLPINLLKIYFFVSIDGICKLHVDECNSSEVRFFARFFSSLPSSSGAFVSTLTIVIPRRMHSEGYGSCPMCVCLCVCTYSSKLSNKPSYQRFHWLYLDTTKKI